MNITLIICCCIILFILALVSIVFLNNAFLFVYLFTENNVGLLHNPRDYKLVNIWTYIQNFWLEMWYILGKYYLLPLKYISFTIKCRQPTDTAVLLIHGYCRNQTDWWWLRKQLKNQNFHLFTVNLSPDLASIAQIALDSLPQKVASIRQQTNCKNLILLGHSMGGLVASYYKEFLDNDHIVRAVITLGSPLYGTKVSVMGAGENAKDMCPDTKFLAELHARMDNTPQQYFQIASQLDNLIFPWRSALLTGSPTNQQLILPMCGHLALLHATEVATQLKAWLLRT